MDRLNSPAIGLITSKDWTLEHLLASGGRFRGVETISAKSGTPEQIASIVKDYEQRNVPLVVRDFHHHPDWPEFFTPQWLESHYGSQTVEVRNVHGERLDRESTVAELISSLRHAPPFAYQGEHERLYGKDMNCPSEWKNWIKTSDVLPHSVIPGTTGDILPETVETLMSYLGISDTFTPLHKDPCASYGQNIMCYTEDEGRSFWFMTNPSDCGIVAEYFRTLGHELDWEDHVATLEEFANAPFDVYVCEQRLGDLVLIPPRSFHQVINAGGITIKTSWSRMSIRSLEIALYHELPIYRRVCRPETYRVKRTIYDTLMLRAAALETLINDTPDSTHSSVNPLCKEVARLIDLLDDVLEQEYCTQHRRLRQVSNGATPGGNEHVCSFCGADIFLSFFQCDSCSPRDGSGGSVCLCPTCVVEGRTCKCGGMEPVQSGSFRDLLGNRNHAMVKLQAAYKAGFYDEDPEVLSDQHLIDSVKTTFQAASVLLGKRREMSGPQKITRTCMPARKGSKSHVVDGWAIIVCGGCHSGKCFSHILEAGIHSSEALMIVELEKKDGRWHSIHTNRQKHYKEDVVPRLIWATKKGDKTEIEERLAYFAQTFQTPRPLSQWVSLGFYDRDLPDPEDVDQLDPVSVVSSENVNSQITEDSSVQHLTSDSPAVSTTVDAPLRKRKRSSRPSSSKLGPDPPSQPPMDGLRRGRSSRSTRSSQKWKMDCVLITTLPPVLIKKTDSPKPFENEGDHPQKKPKKRGRERKRGKQRAAAPGPRAPRRPVSRSLANEPVHSRSHSVSSLRPPLFEPEPTPSTKPDLEMEVGEDPVKVESEVDDADDEVYVPFVSHLRQRVESESPTSSVDPPPPSSLAPSPSDDKPPYYTVVATKPRKMGSGIRFAPNQRQIAKTPAVIYTQSRVRQPVAGPSHPTRVGPPKHKLPERSLGPKLRPAAELPPPRPPPPIPGLVALETKMNSFVDENQKLRDELATAKHELAAARTELTAALTRVDTLARDLHGLETMETQLEEMKGDNERLSNLLSSENLFSSERFRSNIQAEVKSSFGYYWPSAKTDMKNQLWKELPPPVKEHVEKEVGRVSEGLQQVKSELAALQQKTTVGGSIQNGDPGVAGFKQAIERLEKKQEELQAMILKVGKDQESERTRRGSASRLTPSDAGNAEPPYPPTKSPSPRPDNPPQDPRRRGAQTPPAASDQNSYPLQQGSDDEAGNLPPAGLTQDPNHNALLSLSSPIFLLNPTCSLRSEFVPPQPTPIRTSPQRSHPLISTSWSPIVSQQNHGTHPFHVIQPGSNNSTTVNNPVLPVAAGLTPGPQRSPPARPAHMPRSESASILAHLPAGMHVAHNQPSPAASARPLPHPTFDDPQTRSSEFAAKRSQSLPTFLSETNATVLLRDGHIPPPNPTVDAAVIPGPLYLRSSATPFDQHTRTGIHQNPILMSSNQREQREAAQKRKASEALPPPDPPHPSKIQKVEKRKFGSGNDSAGDSGAAPTQGGLWRQRAKPVTQPGPSNSHSRRGTTEGKDNREDGEVDQSGEAEDGEVYGGREPGEQPDDPAHPHGVEYAWNQSGTLGDLHDFGRL